MRRALRIDRSIDWTEFGLAFLGLVLVGGLTLGPHILHGGFYLDDWSNAAGALQPPGSPHAADAFSYFADLTGYRPVLVVYVPLTYFVLGMHMGQHLFLAAGLAVFGAAMFYAVLRTVGVPWIHAWLIAALAVVFPWSDSTRMWATAAQLSLAISLAFAGLFLALVGLRRGGMRWHLGAATLFLLSILTYEVALPMIAACGLLYWLLAGWKAAWPRWLIDLAIVFAGAIWVGTHTAREASGLKGNFEHLRQIIEAGGTLLGRSGWALGNGRTTIVLVAIAATFLGGAIVCLARKRRSIVATESWGLREWLLLSLGGLLLAALGWTMFVPADPYYTPSVYGMTNRVNALAAFGLIVVVYGSLGVFGSMIGTLAPRSAPLTGSIVTSLLAILLLVTYADVLHRHIGIWNKAYASEVQAIESMRRSLPRLPPETVVFASGYPANETLGVPIVSASWDLDGMVKMGYDDFSLTAHPVLPGLRVTCLPDGARLEGEGAPETVAPYGRVRLVDLASGRHSAPAGRPACERVAERYVPGPLYLSQSY